MKKTVRLFLCLAACTAILAGCSAGSQDLVSKSPFPEFSETDTEGNSISSDIFSDYDVTIVNFWNNGCGTCIAEMPELEEMYQEFRQDNINLIGVGTDSGEGEEQLDLAKRILAEKGVTYQNVVPSPENDFYKEFIAELSGYPTTYIVDSEGNIIGAPLIGNVKEQMDTLQKRIEQARGNKE